MTLSGGVTGDELLKADHLTVREHERVLQNAVSTAGQLQERAAAGELDSFVQLVRQFQPTSRTAAKLPRRVLIYFHRCPCCRAGTLRTAVHTGAGRPIVKLLYKIELPKDFISKAETALSPS